VDLGTAIKKPTTNVTNLVIGIILSIIPLVNLLTISGYLIRVANRTMNKDDSLPGFDNIGELVVDSLKYLVISIVYMIPAMIVIGLAAGSVISAVLGASMAGGDPSTAITNAIMGSIGTAGILFLVGIILAILGAVMVISGMLNYAKTKQFGKAFAVGEVIGNFFNTGFIIAMIVGIVLYSVAGIIGGLLMMIPVIGFILWFVVFYMAQVAVITVVAEAYP